MNELIDLLRSHRIRYGTEKQMQDDVELVLRKHRFTFTREYRTGTGPIDFRTDDGVGIECKVSGGPSAILSQLIRYADDSAICSLILVTSRRTHRRTETELRGKPFRVIWVARNAL